MSAACAAVARTAACCTSADVVAVVEGPCNCYIPYCNY